MPVDGKHHVSSSRRGRRPGRDERSVSPVVGLALLFGMVFVGAVILAAAGMTLTDELGATSERERTVTCLDEAEHRINTVVAFGTDRPLPCDGGTFVDDGELSLIWHDEPLDDLDGVPRGDDEATVTASLGAIEYESGDRTYAYQSGGTWELRRDGALVLSGPNVGYGDDLRITVLTIDEADFGSDDTLLRRNAEGSLADDIRESQRAARREGYTNLTLVVESKYHDGWAAHLNESMRNDNATVHHDAANATVRVDVADALSPAEPAFVVATDEGLVGGGHADRNVFVGRDTPSDPRAGFNRPLNVSAVVENVGELTGTQDVGFSVVDPDVDLESTNENVTIDGGAERREFFTFTPGDLNRAGVGLEWGEVYEYDVRTDDDSLDEYGSFYVAFSPDPYLVVRNPRVDGADATDGADPVVADEGNVTVAVDVHNIGGADADGESLELSVEVDESPEPDPYGLEDEADPVIDRTYGENETATWELNRSSLLEGTHTFTVTATGSGESATGHFVVEDGVDVGDTELVLDPGTDVNVSVIGSELSRHGYGGNWWLPTYVNVFTQPVDEDNEPIGDPVRHEGMDWVDTNINRQDDRLTIFEYGFTTDERVSLMLQATSYLRCTDWKPRGEVDGYDVYDCDTGDEHSELVDLTANTATEESNVRVLNATRNTMPELEPGAPVQLRADELLQRDGVDVEVTENDDADKWGGEGYDLHLGENEFVFLFELTHHPEQYNNGPTLPGDVTWTNDRYWQEAFDRNGEDPNFNDAIAHVEIDAAGDPIGFGFDGVFHPGVGDPIDVGTGSSTGDDGGSTGDSGVEVGGDEIIIG